MYSQTFSNISNYVSTCLPDPHYCCLVLPPPLPFFFFHNNLLKIYVNYNFQDVLDTYYHIELSVVQKVMEEEGRFSERRPRCRRLRGQEEKWKLMRFPLVNLLLGKDSYFSSPPQLGSCPTFNWTERSGSSRYRHP